MRKGVVGLHKGKKPKRRQRRDYLSSPRMGLVCWIYACASLWKGIPYSEGLSDSWAMSVFILDRSVIFSLNLVNIVSLQSISCISLLWGVRWARLLTRCERDCGLRCYENSSVARVSFRLKKRATQDLPFFIWHFRGIASTATDRRWWSWRASFLSFSTVTHWAKVDNDDGIIFLFPVQVGNLNVKINTL